MELLVSLLTLGFALIPGTIHAIQMMLGHIVVMGDFFSIYFPWLLTCNGSPNKRQGDGRHSSLDVLIYKQGL